MIRFTAGWLSGVATVFAVLGIIYKVASKGYE